MSTTATTSPNELETATSGPTPSQNGSPIPTLSTLPPELKSLIVNHIAEIDASTLTPDGISTTLYPDSDLDLEDYEDEDASDDASCCSTHREMARERRDERARQLIKKMEEKKAKEQSEGKKWSNVHSCMWAIASVDREFNALAQQYLWVTIGLSGRSMYDLIMFKERILPLRSAHIRAIELDGADEIREIWIETGLQSSIVNVSLELFPRQSSSMSDEEHEKAYRRHLFAEVIRACPHLDTVDFYLTDVDPDLAPESYLGRVGQRSEISNALMESAGARMVDMDIGTAGEPFDVSYGFLAKFLTDFPLLERLAIHYGFSPSGQSDMIPIIANFTTLTSLTIEEASFVNEDFANADFKCPLKLLALASCPELSLTSFITLVKKFSATLETLDIDETPMELPDVATRKRLMKPLNLPHLTTLVLSTMHTDQFLILFETTKLESITVGFCPVISADAWQTFFNTKVATTVSPDAGGIFTVSYEGGSAKFLINGEEGRTVPPPKEGLREIVFGADHDLTEDQQLDLQAWCYAKGITFRVEEGESDDDDDDEDDYDEDEDEDYESDEWVDDEGSGIEEGESDVDAGEGAEEFGEDVD
ncbi:hypothetical protein T439DRAFT_350382 [Meredithblackwellia eburnea MCA 4105]